MLKIADSKISYISVHILSQMNPAHIAHNIKRDEIRTKVLSDFVSQQDETFISFVQYLEPWDEIIEEFVTDKRPEVAALIPQEVEMNFDLKEVILEELRSVSKIAKNETELIMRAKEELAKRYNALI